MFLSHLRAASWGLGRSCVRTALGLLCCVFVLHFVTEACPNACLCASDIVTCSNQNLSSAPAHVSGYTTRLDLSYNRISVLGSDWTPSLLDKLETFIVNSNALSQISLNAFCKTPHLKHLDLSSNRIKVLNASCFCELKKLEVLLLFNNQISKITPGAFGGLQRLQRIYLSWNRLAVFPVELFVGKLNLSRLEFLDLSYNLLTEVPVQEILSLPARQQAGIYLHENQLTCSCALHTMLFYWARRQFLSVVDFKSDYRCFLPGFNVAVKVLSQLKDFMNCSGISVNASFRTSGLSYEVLVGDSFLVHCDSKISLANSALLWVTPRQKVLRSGSRAENLSVFPNGSLGFQGARLEDSGIYTCVVFDQGRNLNETVEVAVGVGNSTGERLAASQGFSTAFTTLASCAVSVVLVLLYLYLTPCHCWCRTKRTQSVYGGHASILFPVAPDRAHCHGKPCGGKRVVFLEPGAECAHGDRASPRSTDASPSERILRPSRTRSESISAGFLVPPDAFVA